MKKVVNDDRLVTVKNVSYDQYYGVVTEGQDRKKMLVYICGYGWGLLSPTNLEIQMATERGPSIKSTIKQLVTQNNFEVYEFDTFSELTRWVEE